MCGLGFDKDKGEDTVKSVSAICQLCDHQVHRQCHVQGFQPSVCRRSTFNGRGQEETRIVALTTEESSVLMRLSQLDLADMSTEKTRRERQAAQLVFGMMKQEQESFDIERLQDTIQSQLPQTEDFMRISSVKSLADIEDQVTTPKVLSIEDDPGRNAPEAARSSTDPTAQDQPLAIFQRDPNLSVGRFANEAIINQLGRLKKSDKAADVQRRVVEAKEFKDTIDAANDSHFRKLAEEAHTIALNKCCQCMNDIEEMRELSEEWFRDGDYHPLYCPECNGQFCAGCYIYAADRYLRRWYQMYRERGDPVSIALIREMNDTIPHRKYWVEPCNRLRIEIAADFVRNNIINHLLSLIHI